MRVIFDANILISFLLSRHPNGTIATVIEHCLASEDVTVLVPPQLIRETTGRVESKPYLRAHISRERVTNVLTMFATYAESLPELEQELESYARDRHDDYLVAYGLVHEADYIVTGDEDLLVLGQIRDLRMIDPLQLYEILGY